MVAMLQNADRQTCGLDTAGVPIQRNTTMYVSMYKMTELIASGDRMHTVLCAYRMKYTSEDERKLQYLSLTQWYVEKTTLTSMTPPSSYVWRIGYPEFSFP